MSKMEIERKWLVSGWPDLTEHWIREEHMEQAYLVVRPTVRIRKEAETGGNTSHILCIKQGAGIAREEIEIEISEEKYNDIKRVIGLPPINKVRRTWKLSDGYLLEVNDVDAGMDSAFMYAEVEFGSIREAREWNPEDAGLGEYLRNEVTEEPGQSMGAYWLKTRGGND